MRENLFVGSGGFGGTVAGYVLSETIRRRVGHRRRSRAVFLTYSPWFVNDDDHRATLA